MSQHLAVMANIMNRKQKGIIGISKFLDTNVVSCNNTSCNRYPLCSFLSINLFATPSFFHFFLFCTFSDILFILALYLNLMDLFLCLSSFNNFATLHNVLLIHVKHTSMPKERPQAHTLSENTDTNTFMGRQKQNLNICYIHFFAVAVALQQKKAKNYFYVHSGVNYY